MEERRVLSGEVKSWIKIKNPANSQMVGRLEQFQRKRIVRESSPTLHRASTA
jgi:hypothetical protein